MERGLLWLPLLGVFIGLAWAGWNEYQKVQAYEAWATDFDRSKYDIKAVLGQAGERLTWGRPTRRGPVDLASLSLGDVDALTLQVNDEVLDADVTPPAGQPGEIIFTLTSGEQLRVPFTDAALAQRWKKALHQSLQTLKSAST
jgi:hypothetical protein